MPGMSPTRASCMMSGWAEDASAPGRSPISMSWELSFGVAALPFAAGCAGAPAKTPLGKVPCDMSFSVGNLDDI